MTVRYSESDLVPERLRSDHRPVSPRPECRRENINFSSCALSHPKSLYTLSSHNVRLRRIRYLRAIISRHDIAYATGLRSLLRSIFSHESQMQLLQFGSCFLPQIRTIPRCGHLHQRPVLLQVLPHLIPKDSLNVAAFCFSASCIQYPLTNERLGCMYKYREIVCHSIGQFVSGLSHEIGTAVSMLLECERIPHASPVIPPSSSRRRMEMSFQASCNFQAMVLLEWWSTRTSKLIVIGANQEPCYTIFWGSQNGCHPVLCRSCS